MNRTRTFAFALAVATCGSAPLRAQTPPPATLVEVAKVDVAPIAPRRWVPGSVVSRDDAKLATSAAGRLDFVAEVGTRLAAGDRVAKLEDQAIRLHLEDARSEVARIRAQRELAQRQSDRYEKLAQNRSIAANQVDEARAQVDQYAAQLRQAEARVRTAQYELEQTEVRAPFPGVVSERYVQRGEFVATGASIAHLVDTTHLEARVQAPLALARMVTNGMQLQVRAGTNASAGTIRAIVPVGEERTRQFELRVSLGTDTPMVGSAIEVALPEQVPVRTMAVPRDALVIRSDGSYVVRVVDAGTSERVPVQAGASDGELVAVQGALAAGDLVVVRGAERLGDGQGVRIATRAEVVAGADSTARRPPG